MKPPSAAAPSRLYVLDGLRLVAALFVVSFHFTLFEDAWGGPDGAALPTLSLYPKFGWLGVYLYFLIRGLLICMSAEACGLGQFVAAWITRLYPAYWAAVLTLWWWWW